MHLASSGYHLCIRNETRTVSFLVVQTVPYTVSVPCGGWFSWKTCTVTLHKLVHQTENKTVNEQVTRCCDGYAQVGRYCALCECDAHRLSIRGFEGDRLAQICLKILRVCNIWWCSKTHRRRLGILCDLSACGAVCKRPDGSAATELLQIYRR